MKISHIFFKNERKKKPRIKNKKQIKLNSVSSAKLNSNNKTNVELLAFICLYFFQQITKNKNKQIIIVECETFIEQQNNHVKSKTKITFNLTNIRIVRKTYRKNTYTHSYTLTFVARRKHHFENLQLNESPKI